METPRRRARSPTGSNVSIGSDADASRRRTSKRDDAIRRKAEKDLTARSNRRRSDLARRSSSGDISATVKLLNPSEAFTTTGTTSCLDVAQLMAAKRTDCVLVVEAPKTAAPTTSKSSQGKLIGILTAKDLAFRVAGAGLSPQSTLASAVMTPNPTTVSSRSEATQALNVMVAGHFRHLPVVDDAAEDEAEPKLTGVLDVTKVMKDAMERLDRASEQSRKLKEALDALESEWSINAVHISQYSEVLRERLAAPTMMAVISEQLHETPIVNIRSNVREALRVMKETKQTGVSIVDDEKNLAGILTTKDVVLRVIAAGLEPDRTAVVRVMTPKPDFVPSDFTVLDGLKKMYNHRYLHLPVMDGSNFVGMVDVLELTYLILNQMKAIQTENAQDGPPTMAWSKFWDTTMHTMPDTDSYSEGPHSHHDSITIRAEDSISNVGAGDNESAVSQSIHASHLQVYKFKDSKGQVHRLYASSFSFSELLKAVAQKISKHEANLSLSYIDDDGDHVQLTSDEDLIHAVGIAKKLNWARIMLSVEGDDATASKPGSAVASVVDSRKDVQPVPVVPVVAVTPPKAKESKGSIVINTGGTIWPPKGFIMTDDGQDLTPLVLGVGVGLAAGLVVVMLFTSSPARPPNAGGLRRM